MIETLIIKRDSPEWNYMWNWLGQHPLNEGIAEPTVALNQGECWQYLMSSRQGLKTLHSFRHRHHSKTNDRVSLTVEASKNMNDADIELIRQMK